MQIVALRGTAEQTFSVAAVEQRSEFDSLSATADPEKNLVADLGILGVEIDSRIASMASGLRDPHGVIVLARAAGARSEVPLQPRDVVRSVNNKPVTTLQGLRDLVKGLAPGTPVVLQVQREGRLTYVSFTVE